MLKVRRFKRQRRSDFFRQAALPKKLSRKLSNCLWRFDSYWLLKLAFSGLEHTNSAKRPQSTQDFLSCCSHTNRCLNSPISIPLWSLFTSQSHRFLSSVKHCRRRHLLLMLIILQRPSRRSAPQIASPKASLVAPSHGLVYSASA